MSTRAGVLVLAILAPLATATLGGCTTLGYYAQSIGGHFAVVAKRRDIDAMVADPATPADLRARLERAAAMREFARRELDLPDGGSFHSYADLGRPFVVWNVVAAPELDLTPRRWCFPVAGCVSYRGYFDEESAHAFAADLAAEGLDVAVSGARAYSTLGWFDDPLLNTVVYAPDYRLAGIIFHELAHQRLYVAGDSAFNESYAVTVEREGVRRWLASQGTGEDAIAYRTDEARREAFLSLTLGARERLENLYASDLDDDAKRAAKREIFAALGEDYRALKERWGGYAGYDRWFEDGLNNAKLALVETYNAHVAAFERLLAREGGDMHAFHEAARALAGLDREQREQALARLASGQPSSRGSAPAISPASSSSG
ncbi:MAG: aminopeptidase [Gammaproteobacteria bacterium]|nr:aminopeptidase [Gammaproteobacteria bacterium]